MNMKKKKIIAISIACLIAAGAVVAWLAHPRRVVVGFANTPEFMYSRIAQSADAENVEIRLRRRIHLRHGAGLGRRGEGRRAKTHG